MITIVAVAAVLLVWFGLWPRDEPLVRVETAGGTTVPVPFPGAVGSEIHSPRAEEAITDPATSSTSCFEFEFSATLIDRWGLPENRARMLLGPLGAMCQVQGDERKGNDVHMTWVARKPALWIACADLVDGQIHSLRTFEMKAGAPLHLAMGVEDAGVSWSSLAAGKPRLATDTRFGIPMRSLADCMAMGGSSIGVNGPDHFGLAGSRKPAGGIEGIVRQSDGAPAKKAVVALLYTNPRRTFVVMRTTTDAQGRFVFRELPDDEYQVRAGGGAEGLASRRVVVAAGAAIACELQLALGPHLRGRIVDDTGRRVDHWRIVCEVAEPPSFTVTDSDAAGSFVVPIPEGSRSRLLVWPPGGEQAPPVRTIPDVAAVGVELLVPAVFPDPGAGFILRLPQWPTPYGTMSSPQAELFLFQEESGRGVGFHRDDSGALSVHGLAAGFYRIAGTTLSHGFLDLGRHWHDGRNMIDLGTIELPEFATVRFELPKNDRVEPELCQIRDDIDLRIAGLDLLARDGVQLPPGHYVVHWQLAGTTATAPSP